MRVEIGHRSGIESKQTDSNGSVYVGIDGPRTTVFNIPDGVSVSEAQLSIKDALAYHIQNGHQALWVSSDNKSLEEWVSDQLGVPADPIHSLSTGQLEVSEGDPDED